MKNHIQAVAKANKGWSLYQLAKQMDMPQQTIYSWARARTQPSWENLDRLCDILDCQVDDLLTAEKPITPVPLFAEGLIAVEKPE